VPRNEERKPCPSLIFPTWSTENETAAVILKLSTELTKATEGTPNSAFCCASAAHGMEQIPSQKLYNALASIMKKNIKVFRAISADLDITEEILCEYYAAVGVIVRDDRSQLAKYFHNGAGVWLARDGGAAVGCVVLRPLPAMPDACEVKRLYVKPSHRRLGIAELLMNSLEAYAASYGYTSIYLDSKDDLDAALEFYTRRGYVACDRYNDNQQATIFMCRRLG